MKFWEAMKIVDEGGMVRRKAWVAKHPNVYVGIVKNSSILLIGSIGILGSYTPKPKDTLADDWEQVLDLDTVSE